MADVEKKSNNKEPEFTKEQLANSKKYENRVDLINALLDDNAKYTLSQVDSIIKNFMERPVK